MDSREPTTPWSTGLPLLESTPSELMSIAITDETDEIPQRITIAITNLVKCGRSVWSLIQAWILPASRVSLEGALDGVTLASSNICLAIATEGSF